MLDVAEGDYRGGLFFAERFEAGFGVGITEGGVFTIGHVAEVRDTNLQIAVDFPEAVILAPARKFLERMIALGLIIAIGSAVAVRELTARFAQPLVDLTAATEAVAGGNFAPSSDPRPAVGPQSER